MKSLWPLLLAGVVIGLFGSSACADALVDLQDKTLEGNITGFDDYCVLMTAKDGKKTIMPIEQMVKHVVDATSWK